MAGLLAVGKTEGPTLLVFPEAQRLAARDYLALHHAALQQCADLKDRFVVMDLSGKATAVAGTDDPANDVDVDAADSDIAKAASNFRAFCTDAENLQYGAVYFPNLATTLPFAFAATQVNVTGIAGCSRLSDLKDGSVAQTHELALAAIGKLVCKLPPGGAVAGIYVATDKARGVWKAPANVKIVDVAEPTIAIDDAEQEALNVDSTGGKSIDAIRAFVGKGTLVWGARTLAGNDNEWRYVNIRRCCIFIETSIRRAARQFALEANDATTWSRVRGMVESFLASLWRQGALIGVKTSDAFFVQIGLGTSMTQLDVSEGRMIVTIGLSLLRPAEFAVLRIVQTMPLP